MPGFVKNYTFKIRVFDEINKKMITDQQEARRLLWLAPANYVMSQWIGHIDDSDDRVEICLGDICDVHLVNEFGSVEIYKAIVGFNPEKAQFTYDVFNSKQVMGTRLLKAYVTGNIYENPEQFSKKD